MWDFVVKCVTTAWQLFVLFLVLVAFGIVITWLYIIHWIADSLCGPEASACRTESLDMSRLVTIWGLKAVGIALCAVALWYVFKLIRDWFKASPVWCSLGLLCLFFVSVPVYMLAQAIIDGIEKPAAQNAELQRQLTPVIDDPNWELKAREDLKARMDQAEKNRVRIYMEEYRARQAQESTQVESPQVQVPAQAPSVETASSNLITSSEEIGQSLCGPAKRYDRAGMRCVRE